VAVDLANYVDSIRREVNPPGVEDFPNATDTEWTGRLADAFWEARLDGLLVGFTCDENGLVIPMVPQGIDPSTLPDMGRDMVQLVVLYASFQAIRNTLRDLRTAFTAQAGPVRFDYQHSANLLVEIMKDLINRRDIILMRLSDLGSTNVTVIDSIAARDRSFVDQMTYWVSSGDLLPGPWSGRAGISIEH
jgi:hypothetical protein